MSFNIYLPFYHDIESHVYEAWTLRVSNVKEQVELFRFPLNTQKASFVPDVWGYNSKSTFWVNTFLTC